MEVNKWYNLFGKNKINSTVFLILPLHCYFGDVYYCTRLNADDFDDNIDIPHHNPKEITLLL